MFLKVLRPQNPSYWEDTNLILSDQVILLSENWHNAPDFSNPSWVQKKEYRFYSQFCDDGIIQWLIHDLNIYQGSFIEFVLGYYYEDNTHFLANRFLLKIPKTDIHEGFQETGYRKGRDSNCKFVCYEGSEDGSKKI